MRHRLGLLLVLPLLLVTYLAGAGPAAADTINSTATGLQRDSSTSDTTSWSSSVPSFQHPTDSTNNEPLLIILVAVLAVLVIGGVAALIRLRVRGDDADL